MFPNGDREGWLGDRDLAGPIPIHWRVLQGQKKWKWSQPRHVVGRYFFCDILKSGEICVGEWNDGIIVCSRDTQNKNPLKCCFTFARSTAGRMDQSILGTGPQSHVSDRRRRIGDLQFHECQRPSKGKWQVFCQVIFLCWKSTWYKSFWLSWQLCHWCHMRQWCMNMIDGTGTFPACLAESFDMFQILRLWGHTDYLGHAFERICKQHRYILDMSWMDWLFLPRFKMLTFPKQISGSVWQAYMSEWTVVSTGGDGWWRTQLQFLMGFPHTPNSTTNIAITSKHVRYPQEHVKGACVIQMCIVGLSVVSLFWAQWSPFIEDSQMHGCGRYQWASFSVDGSTQRLLWKVHWKAEGWKFRISWNASLIPHLKTQVCFFLLKNPSKSSYHHYR